MFTFTSAFLTFLPPCIFSHVYLGVLLPSIPQLRQASRTFCGPVGLTKPLWRNLPSEGFCPAWQGHEYKRKELLWRNQGFKTRLWMVLPWTPGDPEQGLVQGCTQRSLPATTTLILWVWAQHCGWQRTADMETHWHFAHTDIFSHSPVLCTILYLFSPVFPALMSSHSISFLPHSIYHVGEPWKQLRNNSPGVSTQTWKAKKNQLEFCQSRHFGDIHGETVRKETLKS